MFYAEGIIKLNKLVYNYSRQVDLKVRYLKLVLNKKEFLNLYKYRFLNFLKFKNIFNLLLFLMPL
jgi:hypothetical protein